ncbi:MAG: TVP38/TMEM64 family protein [Acetobacter sp.]|nr:TVP38/TMEM64 family protein [Acetobacter sp.]
MTFSLSHILSQQTYSATLFIRPCLMLLVLVCGTLGLNHVVDIRHVLEGEALAQRASGYVLFLGIVTLWCSFGLPRQVVGFVAGLTYGIAVGFIIITIASTFGYLAGFLWARWGGRCWVRAQCGKRFASLDRFITDQPFLSILTLRLLPVGSALLVNFLGGVSSMRVMPFIGATVLGALPQKHNNGTFRRWRAIGKRVALCFRRRVICCFKYFRGVVVAAFSSCKGLVC